MFKYIKDRKLLLIVAQFCLFLLLFIFNGFYGSVIHWAILFVSPFIIWFDKIRKGPNALPKPMQKTLKYYILFGVLIVLTALPSPYPIDIPLSRALCVASVTIIMRLAFSDVQTKEKHIAICDGIVMGAIIYSILTYSKFYGDMMFDMNAADEAGWGNKNAVGNFLFCGFVASVIRSFFSNDKRYFYIFSTYIWVCIFLSQSLKIITTSSIIYVFYILKYTKDAKSFVSLSLFAVVAISVIGAILPQYLQSGSFQLFSDRFNMMIGNEEAATVEYNVTELRIELMHQAMQIFYDNPIIGIGLENTRLCMLTYTHNSYVEVLAGGGIILASSFYAFMLSIFFFICRLRNTLFFIILGCIMFIAGALRIYDFWLYIFLLFLLMNSVYIVRLEGIKGK